MRKTLDDIMLAFEAIHASFNDKDHFKNWLFEYACQTIEYEGKSPQKVPDYLTRLMRYKATQIYQVAYRAYFEHKSNGMELTIAGMHEIPEIVRREHQKQIKIKALDCPSPQ